MFATGTAVAPAAAPAPVNAAAVERKIKLQAGTNGGARWFMAVALFSVINSALMFFNAKMHFIVGLGVTQIADTIGKLGGTVGSIAGLIVSLFAAAMFLVFWKFAREGNQWAFIAGMVLYALDGLIFLGFGLWLDLGFHAFALFGIYKGLTSLNELNQLNRQRPSVAPSQAVIQ
ncbi:MAG TPA: hypothetical protein VMS18_05450 [Candidatus Binatia bacterium]|nr:hypothetical protein [Candidatus Binatia bacterium]